MGGAKEKNFSVNGDKRPRFGLDLATAGRLFVGGNGSNFQTKFR